MTPFPPRPARSPWFAAALAAALAPGCLWDTEASDDAGAAADGSGDDTGDDGDQDDGADAPVEAPACAMDYELDGVVAGRDAYPAGYAVDATFYNASLEEIVLGEVDFELMAAMGLDPQDEGDQDRFAYFVSGFDLRNLYTEHLGTDHIPGILPKVGRDLSIALYDLTAHDVQPGTPIAVFDASGIDALRDAGDLDALGALLRTLIDDMRSNGRPDAVITFAPDRSQESLVEAIWIAMLAPGARFAAGGTASFDSPLDDRGSPIEAFVYPVAGVTALSLSLDATFLDGTLSLDAECLHLQISG